MGRQPAGPSAGPAAALENYNTVGSGSGDGGGWNGFSGGSRAAAAPAQGNYDGGSGGAAWYGANGGFCSGGGGGYPVPAAGLPQPIHLAPPGAPGFSGGFLGGAQAQPSNVGWIRPPGRRCTGVQ